MNRQRATDLNIALVEAYVKLHHSIDVARCGFCDTEFHDYCRAAGKALGYMLVDHMDPIYKQYPDLMPEWLKDTELTLERPIGIESRGDAQKRLGELINEIAATLRCAVTILREPCTDTDTEAEHCPESCQIRLDEVIQLVVDIKNHVANNPVEDMHQAISGGQQRR